MPKLVSIIVALFVFLVNVRGSLAQGPFFALIVNGSSSLNVEYADGYLVVHFRRTRHAAGQPGSYVQNVRPGTAAWVDRPLNDQEPTTLKQRMTPAQADAAMQRLRQNGGYWRFYCRNTGAGYLEASRSEAAYAQVLIDRG